MLDKLNKRFLKGYENFFKDNNKFQNLLFFIAIILFYVINFNKISRVISIDSLIIDQLKVAITTILLLKIIITKEKLSTYLLFLLCIVIAITCDCATGLNYDMLILVLIILSARNIDVDKVIKLILCLNIIVLGFNCIKYIMDYNTNVDLLEFQKQFVRSNGKVRHTFYFYHPNTFSNNLFWSWMMYFYLNFGKKKEIIKTCIIGIVFAIITYIFPNSRNAALFYIIAILLYFVFQNKKITNNELFKININLFFLICFFVSWLLLVFLGQNNIVGELVSKINSLLHNRILIGKSYLAEYGVSIFGNLFTSEKNMSAIGVERIVFDNWYYYMIVRFGLLISIFYCFTFSKSLLKLSEQQNWQKVFVIVIFLLYNCIECVGVIPIISIPYFFIGMFL